MRVKIEFLLYFTAFFVAGTEKFRPESGLEVVESNESREDGLNIDFDSKLGKDIFFKKDTELQSYFKLSEHFTTQNTQSYCAVASGVIVLNSLEDKVQRPVDKVYKPYPYFTQELFMANQCVKQVLGAWTFFFMGFTLDQLAKSLECYNAVVEVVFFSSDEASLANQLKTALDSGKFVIANINRSEIDEVGYGHFSPIGGYSFVDGELTLLFMDVARYKYKPKWIKAKHVFKAMEKQDKVSEKSRGFLIVD